MKNIKKIVGLFAFMTLFIAPVAFAATEDGNVNTGRDSENNITIETKSNVSVVTDNDKVEENDVVVEQNTGENRANENSGEEGSVAIATGETKATVGVENKQNITEVNVGEKEEEEEAPIGGGEAVVPPAEQVSMVTPAPIGGGVAETPAIGGGELPIGGANGLIMPFILASITTFLTYLKFRKVGLKPVM